MFAGPWFGLPVGIFTVGASNRGIEGEEAHLITNWRKVPGSLMDLLCHSSLRLFFFSYSISMVIW